MEDFELTNPDNIAQDLMDIKESARIKKIISKLYMYDNDPQELTDIYTDILFEDNVSYIITKISQDKIFMKHFPEFYEKNEYGENVINCQQNSDYHKYGVFKHTLYTVETVGNPQIPIGDWQKKLLKWTMLLHDIGKPYVKTISEDSKESFAGHDEKSVELAKNILDRFYFTEEEKKIILTLIKYHDKFLNDGEITYDNMKFLASELENNKELFYLLIDVKDADAKSKSVDVYNKYKLVKAKYIEFTNTYFSYKNSEHGSNINNINDANLDDNKQQINNEISIPEMDSIINNLIDKKNIVTLYQPVIDVKLKKVYGYDATVKIEYSKEIDTIELFNHAKDSGLYDKVQQILLVDRMDSFSNIDNKEATVLFINSDLDSYERYPNKPRIYDMMAKNKLIIKFINYEKRDISSIQDTINIIHKNKGYVALDNFGTGALKIEDLNLLNIDYIIPDISIVNDIYNDLEKQKYLSELITYAISKDIKIIIQGVNNTQIFETILKIGGRYLQGNYFAQSDRSIGMINGKLNEIIIDGETDTIL